VELRGVEDEKMAAQPYDDVTLQTSFDLISCRSNLSMFAATKSNYNHNDGVRLGRPILSFMDYFSTDLK
jgi:hypothetical protein